MIKIIEIIKGMKKLTEVLETQTSFDKICILCNGYWNLPKGYVKGFCFNRANHWFPENLKNKFICAECATFLLKRLVQHSQGSMYKEFDWLGDRETRGNENE